MDDKKFMLEAIKDAKESHRNFGAVIIKNNKIIAKAGKRPRHDSKFHAETSAITKACKKLRTKKLSACVMYTTCEPCPMCFYVSYVSKIKRVVYGASINDAIEAGYPEIRISARELSKKSGNKVKLTGNILRDECVKVLNGH